MSALPTNMDILGWRLAWLAVQFGIEVEECTKKGVEVEEEKVKEGEVEEGEVKEGEVREAGIYKLKMRWLTPLKSRIL